MFPALTRSCFSSLVNVEDAAVAEVQSVMSRAWLCGTSEFGDPFKGTLATASGLPDAHKAPRPWHVAKALLKMHVATCKVRKWEESGYGKWMSRNRFTVGCTKGGAMSGVSNRPIDV